MDRSRGKLGWNVSATIDCWSFHWGLFIFDNVGCLLSFFWVRGNICVLFLILLIIRVSWCVLHVDLLGDVGTNVSCLMGCFAWFVFVPTCALVDLTVNTIAELHGHIGLLCSLWPCRNVAVPCYVLEKWFLNPWFETPGRGHDSHAKWMGEDSFFCSSPVFVGRGWITTTGYVDPGLAIFVDFLLVCVLVIVI